MDTERKLRRAHILVVPYPSQGHVNPMLQFCKRLIHKRTKSTLVITKFLSKSFNLRSSSTAAAVSVATISDGFDDGGFRQAKDVDDYLAQMRIAGSQSLADLVKSYEKSGNPVDCIVYDAFLTWALDVAHKCGIKGAAFFTHACAVNYVYYYAACGVLKLPVEAAVAAVELPGLPPLDLPDFPSFIYVHGSYPAYFKMVLNEFSNLGEADFVLVNTFYKLEEEVVHYTPVCAGEKKKVMGENVTEKLLELRRTLNLTQKQLDEQERTSLESCGFVSTDHSEIRRTLKRIQIELVHLELQRDLKAIEARFVTFDVPSLNFDVEPCVDNELSIILHHLDSHTQASSLSYPSLDFNEFVLINVLAFVQDILMGVKGDNLDKARELKTNGERLIAWSFKTNDWRLLEEKRSKPIVNWLISWLITIYFPP